MRLINLQTPDDRPPGNSDAGERGLASLPGREDEFRRGVATALEYAGVLGWLKAWL